MESEFWAWQEDSLQYEGDELEEWLYLSEG